METSLRLFYALWPDEATRKALAGWQASLSGRKVRPQNLHITLAFLGKKPLEMVPQLSNIIKALPAEAILLQLDKTGYFSRKRISWAGMKQTPPGLVRLQHELALALTEKNVSFDKRPHSIPHLTLARHSDKPGISTFNPVVWHARHLVLVESRSGNDPERPQQNYVILAERILENQEKMSGLSDN